MEIYLKLRLDDLGLRSLRTHLLHLASLVCMQTDETYKRGIKKACPLTCYTYTYTPAKFQNKY